MSWREQQAARTRQRIVDTFLELSRGPEQRSVTTAEVSRATGISPATIYRHFPDRNALVTAAAGRDARAGVEDVEQTWQLPDLQRHLEVLWKDLAANLIVTREGALSEAGREMRQIRYRWLAASIREGLRATGRIDDETRERLVAIGSLLAGVHAFLDLHDRQGLTPAEAAATATWAFDTVVRSVTGGSIEMHFPTDPFLTSDPVPTSDPENKEHR
jgi:AcrR family transcriptional regulator